MALVTKIVFLQFQGLNYVLDDDKQFEIQDSYFSSYHTTLVTSYDFTTALRESRKIADDVKAMLEEKGIDSAFFPYSIFYVFYEQYLTIWYDTLFSLGLSLLAIFVVTFLLTGKQTKTNKKYNNF